MEIQFQQPRKGKMSSKFKAKTNSNNNSKFVGVRQRPSGRWVAEIKDTTQKIRMWLGTFETAEAAARAYDEAACLLRGSNTRTNFVTQVSHNSPLASRIQNLLNKRGHERKVSPDTTTTKVATSTSSIKSTSVTSTISSSTSNTSNNTSWTTTAANSTGSSPTSSGFSYDEKVNDHSHLFDDAYKPDTSHCNDVISLSSSCQTSNMSWGFLNANGVDRFPFAEEMLDLPKNVNLMPENEPEFSEFERMKVERQISASLYAMNGVQEYMETVHEVNEAIWDLPPLCSLFC